MKLARHTLAYLATPFTFYRHGLEAAAYEAKRIAAHLLRSGILVYSPIAYTYDIAEVGGLDHLDLSIWVPLEERMCAACDVLIVARLEGWAESAGVNRESERFERAGKHIFDLNPRTFLMISRRNGEPFPDAMGDRMILQNLSETQTHPEPKTEPATR